MARIGNVQSKGAIRWTGGAGAIVAGSNSGAFAEPIVRTGAGVYELAPNPSERFAPQDALEARTEAVAAFNAVVERVSEVLIRVRTFDSATGAAADSNCSLTWDTILKG